MEDAKKFYEDAKIIWGSPLREPPVTQTFCMKVKEQELWFIAKHIHPPGSNEFWMEIPKFGTYDRLDLEATSEIFQREFDPEDIDPIKFRITQYFKDKNEMSRIIYLSKWDCAGVRFPQNWIRVRPL